MIYLFHGTDKAQIQSTIQTWEKAFLEKNPNSTNLTKYTPEQINLPNLISELKSLPFLEDKRLIILPEFPDKIHKDDQKKLATEFKNLPDTTILCIVSYNKLPKTTNPIHKELIKLNKKQPEQFHIKEISTSEKNLTQTIQKIINSYDKNISTHDAKTLSQNLQQNSVKIESETNKLGLYSQSQSPDQTDVTSKQIQDICSYTTETNVFHLMDHITLGQTKQAFQKIQELEDSGEDLMKIFYLIIRQFRILIQLNSLASQNLPQTQITSITKLHPYVVKKTLPQAQKFHINQLLNTYNQLLKIDRQIKTGQTKPEQLHTEIISLIL
jgi:DNA polymerase-3 subunit delta